MNQTLLTSLDFGKKINESSAKSVTGSDFLTKYRGYVMNNPVSCSVVNRFLQESNNLLFDEGIQEISNTISAFINENKFSWLLATTCDRIEESRSSLDMLSKHACKQVRQLLEMTEPEVVNYIKAGALKNVQYVSEFRQIAQQVYKDKMPVMETLEYKVNSPISFVESKNGNLYFCVLDRIFSVDENKRVLEVKAKDMSQKFAYMNSIINQFRVESLGEDGVRFSVIDNKETTYAIESKNMVIRHTKGAQNDEVMTVDEFRTFGNTFTKGVMPQKAAQYSNFFESICKVSENFDDICYLDNVKVVVTGKSNVSLIEGKDNYIVTVHKSFNNRIFSESFNSIIEALEVIKNNTNVDLKSEYKEKINEELTTKAIKEQRVVENEMQLEEIKSRKQIIENLANKFKNDPVKLAIVNNIAKELGSLQESLDEGKNKEIIINPDGKEINAVWSAHKQGNQWVLFDGQYEDLLHYSIKTKKDVINYVTGKTDEENIRITLTIEENLNDQKILNESNILSGFMKRIGKALNAVFNIFGGDDDDERGGYLKTDDMLLRIGNKGGTKDDFKDSDNRKLLNMTFGNDDSTDKTGVETLRFNNLDKFSKEELENLQKAITKTVQTGDTTNMGGEGIPKPVVAVDKDGKPIKEIPTDPNDKDGESKDEESKDGESKDGESKDGESKDGESKDGESKDGESKETEDDEETEVEDPETGEKKKVKMHTGIKGGRYYIDDKGNKVYPPEMQSK